MRYMDVQKQGVLDQVRQSHTQGRKIADILRVLGVKSSTYYRWKSESEREIEKPVLHPSDRITSRSLTKSERNLILDTKERHPELRHRQIQGVLQNQGVYLSASSVFAELKRHGLVEKYERRPAPWDEPFYEVRGADLMWGADWTQIRINHERWYLLSMIDFFSRAIVHWKILKTVTATDVMDLYAVGIDNLNMPSDWPHKPELRVDRGSPNTAYVTRQFFKDIEADLSFARVQRPTDNAITERVFGTLKQEEIYIVGSYPDETSANVEIGRYIEYYCNERPHQALWNFTPKQVHEMNNKTELLKQLKELKIKSWTKRKEYWIKLKQQNHSH